jgi:predicted small integral membrane protein
VTRGPDDVNVGPVTVLQRLGSLRAVVAVFAAVTAVQMTLVAVGNITDYGTNHQFVVHVLAMDTTFQSPNTMWRAITSPAVVTAAYVVIIAWEVVSALVLIAATVAWVRGRVPTARRLSSVGWLMWVLLFGGGFIAIGGEWFQMWQSQDWNGLDPALQNLLIAGVALVLNHLPATEPDTV